MIDSIVSIVTRLGGELTFEYQHRYDILFSTASSPALDAPRLPFNGYQGSFREIKWLGCKEDHFPPSSGQVKNWGSYITVPITCLHGMGRDNYT